MRTDPPDPRVFYPLVWEVARQVPHGKVTTYGRIAELVGPPEGVDEVEYNAAGPRWVGAAMAACPDDVPWQRVVNAQGRISMRAGGGHFRQRALLEAEGVIFDELERIDLNRFGWGMAPTMRQAPLFT